ncbi:metallophosphoesterase family protein [Furfurilactobacillus siliginis]|uniref:Diadenosine tetraphosphatase-like protein n=1 Tax=Furfurilactobacillus siliginis TaxID=348151 RepID=A0A0R2L9I6_9LACO|nr:metallophosphoesterase family protein [Furfurilactobacillus siliginis]KRN96390.1 diadenosine tetraphosphatase-like protein [Furfurilactobacillus siliginis]GEK29015.1 phosphoesterase [Furfurilactobacillus siliginis]
MNTTIAVISDSHGNATALKAVIKDAQAHNADEFWALGDMAFGGASSAECYDLLDSINTTQYLMGNWESLYNRALTKGHFDLSNPTDVYFLVLSHYDYARLTPERNKQLAKLPMTGRKHIANTEISLIHNLPTINFGHTLFPPEAQANFDELLPDDSVDVALYGHTHTPIWRYTTTGQMILNPGSVGQYWSKRPQLLTNRDACYLLLTISDHGITDVDFRRVPFDIQTELTFAREHDFPYVDLYEKLMATGNASTHDLPLLAKINEERHYNELAHDFLASR